jgi:hypothetical protein
MKLQIFVGFMFGMSTIFGLYWVGGGDFARGEALALTAGISILWGGVGGWTVFTIKKLSR